MMIFVACSSPSSDASGPRLVREVTLPPATADLPTLAVTATILRTPEIISPLQQVTIEADFVLVTPTLPPSKTPTTTPTLTNTPTATLTPTSTATATATALLFPTSQIIPIIAPVAAPINEICLSNWFFLSPRPASCPLNPPSASNGVYQSFQNGYMVWVGNQTAIYVMYSDAAQPRWEVYRDGFLEGMDESSSEFMNAPAPNLWQPRRGFGLLWRENQAVRNRIGWATLEWEQPYSVQVQTASDGAVFVSAPGNVVFALFPNRASWQMFTNTNALAPVGSSPLLSPGVAFPPTTPVPLPPPPTP
ncbi:MAG: hypothetical protein NZ750_00540 [Anaerolineae bacterium]|nr:hypothetical protein [Anaerolineae bacterium]MDW8173071.1 hypothetical protein [Anaerolineae bacterium]